MRPSAIPNADSQWLRNRRKLLHVPPTDIRRLKMRRNGSKIMDGDDGDMVCSLERVNQAGDVLTRWLWRRYGGITSQQIRRSI